MKKLDNKILKTNRNKFRTKEKRMKIWIKILPIIMAFVFILGILLSVKNNDILLNELLAFNDKIENDVGNEILPAYQNQRLLTVVNLESPISDDYNIELVKYQNIQCDQIIVDNLDRMIKAAYNDSIELNLIYGYINEKDQDELYNKKFNELLSLNTYSQIRAKCEAEKLIAPGSKSENQTGLLVQFSFDNIDESREYRWIIKNGVDYGFILRYPKFKEDKTGRTFDPTCFRYVGIENAKKMRSFDMCLEEYVDYINEQKAT